MENNIENNNAWRGCFTRPPSEINVPRPVTPHLTPEQRQARLRAIMALNANNNISNNTSIELNNNVLRQSSNTLNNLASDLNQIEQRGRFNNNQRPF